MSTLSPGSNSPFQSQGGYNLVPMYCFSPTMYMIGEAFLVSLVWKSQSSFPVAASATANAPRFSQKKTRPSAVESTPPYETFALLDCGIFASDLRGFQIDSPRSFLRCSSGAVVVWFYSAL